MLLLYAVLLHSHTGATAAPYVGRLPPGYPKGHRKMNPRPITRITKLTSGPRRVQIGGEIKTTFFVPDAAFGEHLAFAKMMENIFFGATSAIDPKALAKSINSIKAFFKTLNKMAAKGYKKMNGIQNFRPRLKELKRKVLVKAKNVVPDWFEMQGYDTTGVGEETAVNETSEEWFAGEPGPSSAPEYTMTDEIKAKFKSMFLTDENGTMADRVKNYTDKVRNFFATKRGIVEDSVKHYGTRAVYNAIEQAIPRPVVGRKMPKLSYDAVVKDVRKELHQQFIDFHNTSNSFEPEFFTETKRKPMVIRKRPVPNENSTRLFRREVNDIDNILAYEDKKRKDKDVSTPSRV